MIYVRFNDPFKHCQYCKKSTKLDYVNTPKGLSNIYWCNRDSCVVTAQCYCDDPNGYEWEPERYYLSPSALKEMFRNE